jgi:hypothetical protein
MYLWASKFIGVSKAQSTETTLCLSRITLVCFNADLNKVQTTANTNLQVETKSNSGTRD